jgi:hypothetical protein
VLERDLTGKLLAELHRCDIADLVKLFRTPASAGGIPQFWAATEDTDAPAASPAAPAKPGTVWAKPGAEVMPGVTLIQHDPPSPVWEARGYRISPKLPSSFPRYRSEP